MSESEYAEYKHQHVNVFTAFQSKVKQISSN